jgi:hypothetical protein
MRHVPTSLYIDTEVFKHHGLRFNSKVFTKLINTFVKGGLRLLVPAMMEKELLRHFKREAEKAAKTVIKGHQNHIIRSIGLADLPTQNELESRCVQELNHQWTQFKDHFTVEYLPLCGNIDDVVDWYFEIIPPFCKPKKMKEFPDAFIFSALDQYNEECKANVAVVSNDGDLDKACANRRYIWYFSNLEDFIEAFQPEISGEDLAQEPVDPTKPIATEDLSELKAILGRGNEVTTIEIRRVLQLVESRGSNYEYFFQNASDSIWLPYLAKEGFFLNPPEIEKTADGNYRVPGWLPLKYLMRAYSSAPDEVIEELSKIPDTENFRVLEGVLEIALETNSAETIARFSHHIFSFIENVGWGHEIIIELLQKPFIFDSALSKITPSILLKIVEFCPDSQAKEKQQRRRENPDDWSASLKPAPRFEQWEYQEILQNGVRSLAEREPYQVARILVDAVASMIRLGIHQDDLDKVKDEDYSEIWSPRIGRQERDYLDSREALVQSLTHACELAYEKVPDSVDALDQSLRNQRWKLFKRLRQHLYALNPSEQTLPWIREFILEHEDYQRWEHSYEFQLMIRKACDYFGARLLNEAEQRLIFDTILSGPSRENFREWMGEQFSEDAFQQRRRYFHWKQLFPFAQLLIGEYKHYFNELKGELQDIPLSDDDYAQYKEARSGFVTFQSPMSTDELSKLKDEDLLVFINEWDEEHRDKDNWLIEINIKALASAFQSQFIDKIITNENRLAFWMKHRNGVERPIYIESMVKAMQELVKQQDFQKLDQWIEFCEWILSHPDTCHIEGNVQSSDESRENPDWRSSRRAVVSFVEVCLSKEVNAPFSARDGLAGLLGALCLQFDWRLDSEMPVLLNRDDQITEAINNTRSRAIDALVNFGFWVRRYIPDDMVPEVTEILENRLKCDADKPLTRPEQAILGMNFLRLCELNQVWASGHKAEFFPQNNVIVWLDAFDSFLRFNRPYRLTFDILKEDFGFALDHFEEFKRKESPGKEFVDTLGQHLMTYYLWGVYPLTGEGSLLETFYQRTSEDRHRWARLFDHVGRSLRNSGKHLDDSLVKRVIAFFDWRVEIKEPLELREFTFWLDAECLDPNWRLEAYSKVLDIGRTKSGGLSIELDVLIKLLPDHMPQVIDNFAKITDLLDEYKDLFIQVDKAKQILKAGFKAKDARVVENAARAKENLLRNSRFEFLDID